MDGRLPIAGAGHASHGSRAGHEALPGLAQLRHAVGVGAVGAGGGLDVALEEVEEGHSVGQPGRVGGVVGGGMGDSSWSCMLLMRERLCSFLLLNPCCNTAGIKAHACSGAAARHKPVDAEHIALFSRRTVYPRGRTNQTATSQQFREVPAATCRPRDHQ